MRVAHRRSVTDNIQGSTAYKGTSGFQAGSRTAHTASTATQIAMVDMGNDNFDGKKVIARNIEHV